MSFYIQYLVLVVTKQQITQENFFLWAMAIEVDKSIVPNPDLWVSAYADFLFNYAITRVQNLEKAEDLVQDTFLSGLSAVKEFKNQSAERTWLVSILKNKIIDYYRKKSTQNEIHVRENYDDNDSFFETQAHKKGTWTSEAEPNAWAGGYKTPMEDEEFYGVLNGCIGKLPEAWAGVFALKNMEELEAKEICKELNISSSNYWVIMHRSKLQLRECMEKNWFNDK